MRSAFYIIIALLLLSRLNFAQKHDNIWLFGGDGGNLSPATDSGGVTMLDFSAIDRPAILNLQTPPVRFFTTNTSMCDSAGNLLFYTNGDHIYSHNHQVMMNGNDLAANNNGQGYRVPQGVMAFPALDFGKYSVLSIEYAYLGTSIFGWKLFFHLVDMNENNNFGKVITKRQLILQDSLTYGKMTAVKHGNGRDWWFVVPTKFSNKYYIGLLSDNGIKIDTFYSTLPVIGGLGQAFFTSDGEKYIRTDDYTLNTPNQVSIFDFDRCTGQLSNFRTKFYPDPNTFGIGCAASPDSRYLYVQNTLTSYQYDLTAPDIFATEQVIATWDGSKYKNIWPIDFYLSQLAPDGRIYINTSNSSVSMHYINFPNRAGAASQFMQNGVPTHTLIQVEMPNFPNYRLGPLDGSACDTLGLDNHPLAGWRWEQEDTSNALQITFTDLAAYEPDDWYWTFGDGATSQDTSPVHLYAAPGPYTVCQVVSNANSADTLCRTVHVGVSATNEAQTAPFAVRAWPNPCTDYLTLGLEGLDYLRGHAELYDLAGRRVARQSWNGPALAWDLTDLPPGVYAYRVTTDRGWVKTGMVVKR